MILLIGRVLIGGGRYKPIHMSVVRLSGCTYEYKQYCSYSNNSLRLSYCYCSKHGDIF